MPHNYAMGSEGHQFSEVGPDGRLVAISWPAGAPREIVHVPPKNQSARFKNRLAAGNIELVEGKVSVKSGTDLPKNTRRLMAGGSQEALDHFEKPAEPVTRWAFDPKLGERVRIPIGKGGYVPTVDDDELSPAERRELAQRAKLARAAGTQAKEPLVEEAEPLVEESIPVEDEEHTAQIEHGPT